MSVTVLTLAELRANALAAIRARFPGRDTSSESLLGKLADALAGLLWDLHLRVRSADRDATPQSSSSYTALANWAFTLGLSNGDGGYGARVAIEATGLQGTATGSNGSVIADGTQLVAGDGETLFETTGGPFTISGGTATISFNATTAGAAGNLEAADVVTFVSPPAGVDSTVTVTTGATNGADVESASDLLDRILQVLQNAPRAVTAADVRLICEEVAGVDRAYVYPLRSGTGTFDVVITQDGSGSSRDPGADVRLAVIDAIDAQRCVTVEAVSVFRPYFVGSGLTIRIRATPSLDEYAFDSTDIGRTVSAYSAGTPSLTLSGAAPSDFQDAVTAGLLPRLQVRTTGVVLPQQVRVTAYNPGTFVCTLEEAFAVAPTNGDQVYAGGPIVDPVAAAILALVDSLGPSKVGGTSDTASDYWADTLYIDQLRWATLDAADTDGTKFVVALVTAPTIGGVALDYQGVDDAVSGPEMIKAKWISVTP